MQEHPDIISRDVIQPLLESVALFLDVPTAIVAGGESIIAHNPPWATVTGCSSDAAQPLTLEQCLRSFALTEDLITALRSGSQPAGAARVLRAPEHAAPLGDDRDYEVRWRQLQMRAADPPLAIIVVSDATSDRTPTGVTESPQERVKMLLIRQTLIEEAERRRLGRALHDSVVQDLAQIRSAVLDLAASPGDPAQLVARIDHVIEEIRTLSFELSPPVLEDLGLIPALKWLADHLRRSDGVNLSIADDAHEPRLSNETRTIIFRAIRELVNNAVKHAPGSEITIKSAFRERIARIVIRDNGPGFDITRERKSPDGAERYGLLSVEQQLRGVGGSFKVESDIGHGTTATITIPFERDEDASHE